MKYIFLIFSIIFIFTACQNDQIQTPKLEKYNSFDKFNHTKEEISFFEKEFENILKIENIDILTQYLNFYKKNSTYFINGKQKVKNLKEKITNLENSNKTLLDTELLKKAKKLIKENKKEAIKIYTKLAKKGNLKAQRELVEIYKINKPDIALKWLEQLVENNDIRSMKEYASANIYMNRPVIVQDLNKALKTYEKLANMGELSSIMRLGNIYEYGYHKKVAPQDKKKSLKYYELAASKNYKTAQKKLYEIYSCKDCKPNRYNPKKAKVLQEILVKDLDKKIITELKEKEEKIKIQTIETKVEPTVEPTVEKKEAIKKEPIIVVKEEKKSKIEIIKCYDMQVAREKITDNCKNKIQTLLMNKKNISKIILIPVIDKNDIAYFEKEKSKQSHLEKLGQNRVIEVEKYLLNTIKQKPKIKKYNYYVISKKNNKGVILKFY